MLVLLVQHAAQRRERRCDFGGAHPELCVRRLGLLLARTHGSFLGHWGLRKELEELQYDR